MITLLLLVGFFSLTSILNLGKAADELSELYAQSIRAEQLRWNTQRQINYSLDFILGDKDAEIEFGNIQENTQSLIEELRSNSKNDIETDLIEALEETQYELVWLMNRFFEIDLRDPSVSNLLETRERLREIGDEVSDDVVTLNRYFSQQQSNKLNAASGAGKTVAWVIGAISALALLQFIALVILSQRWLVKPIGDLNKAAAAISAGNLDINIEFPGKNEWGELADSINKMADSLKETLQQLAVHERSAAMGELAAYASHNIRNPLAGIRAAAQVIIGDLKSNDNEMSQSLQEIIETIDRMDNWLKRLLEFARPLEPQIESTDINKLVKESVEIAGKSYPHKKIRFDWKLSENLPISPVDPILLEQAVMAIAANSFEALDSQGVISVKTCLRESEDKKTIEISVSDNGKGVPSEIQPKLFRAFTTSKDGGTGLGLAQARKIIDIHGGEINLESSPGSGTVVTVRIPLKHD
jgi:signal transduction histidine kinase